MCKGILEPLSVAATVGQDGSIKISPESEFYLAWKKRAWADGQLHSALEELAKSPDDVEPFKYFLEAMDDLAPSPGTKLLDVGCGVGHYSALIERYYPEIEYTGFDFSEAMIDRANENFGNHEFFVADYREVDYAPYDIVLVSGLITVAPEFKEIIDVVSERSKGIVIWHRVFVTDGPYMVHPAIVDTYDNDHGYHFYFNKSHLVKYLLNYFEGVKLWIWEESREGFQIATFVCEHTLDKPTRDLLGTEAGN